MATLTEPQAQEARAPVLSVVERLPNTLRNREVVAILEDVLADALDGKLIAIAIAAVRDDRTADTVCFTGADPLLMLGALVRLQDRISDGMDAMESDSDPIDPAPAGDCA